MPNKPLFIRSATLLLPGSAFHQQKINLLLSEGRIVDIGPNAQPADDSETVDAAGCFLTPGFVDLNASAGEPGQEESEDLDTLSATAAAGGYTGLGLMPNSPRPAHSNSGIAYLVNRAKQLPVNIYPIGCISHHREGKDLAELYDMHTAGAIAFSDGDQPVTDAGLLSRAMQYVKGFGGRLFSYPEDPSLAGNGRMNEGETSTYLGMKGLPDLAEEVFVARDIALAEYNAAALHFSTVSTEGSVGLIRQARARGLKITCDVAAHHLLLTETELEGFDSNYKVKPPLRTEKTRAALLRGLDDGTIDAIVSQHTPRGKEFKDVEFEIAAYGIIALQTVLPVLLRAGLSPERIVSKLAIGPRQILGLETPDFSTGSAADLVVFNPDIAWTYDTTSNRSKSSNSPFIGTALKGKVILTANKEWIVR